MNISEKYCILDIETFTPSGEPDPEKDIIRYIGFKSYTGNYRIYHYTQEKEIQYALSMFDYLIGHNILNYDIPILQRYNYHSNSILIDTFKIVDKRFKSMLYRDLNQGDRSLDRLLEILEAPIKKLTFDYSLLQKDKLENEEYKQLEQYLIGDLDGAEWLFKYCYELFVGFKELMSNKDKKRMSWLTCSPGTTIYKSFCNLTGLPEEYNDEVEMKNKAYDGGYVSEPYNDIFE